MINKVLINYRDRWSIKAELENRAFLCLRIIRNPGASACARPSLFTVVVVIVVAELQQERRPLRSTSTVDDGLWQLWKLI